MSHNTRVRYQRELRTLGALSEHRDYVTRSIGGRKRKVLGIVQITVLPLHPPKAHKHSIPTTDQSGENANLEPQHSVSTTDQSTTDQPENHLLQTNSSAAQELVCQDLSKTTNGVPAASDGAVAVPGPASAADGVSPSGLREKGFDLFHTKGGRGQDSPAPKPPTYPTPPYAFEDYFKTLPFGIKTQCEIFKQMAWEKILLQEPLRSLKEDFVHAITAEALLDYKATCELWEGLIRWIRWWQLPPRQRQLAALAACGIYEPEDPDFDPRPINALALVECCEEDPDCIDCGIEYGVAWMEFADGSTVSFFEGEYEPSWFPGPDPEGELEASDNVPVEPAASA